MISYKDLVDEARIVEVKPRYFGLGFIQITLGTGRYHFYCKDLDPTLNEEELHNHRYNFRSTLLKGALENQIYNYRADQDGAYELTDVTCKPGIEGLPETIIPSADVTLMSKFVTVAGESYEMYHDTFHRVKALTPYTITRLARSPYKKEVAQVLRVKNDPFVCPFETPLTEKDCWDWIKKAIES